jgi:hypothetical protein
MEDVTDYALRLGFSCSGQFLAAVVLDDDTDPPIHSRIGVYDAVTGRPVALLDYGLDPLNDYQFAPDGRTLAVTRDNTVEIWAIDQLCLPDKMNVETDPDAGVAGHA